MRNWIKEVHSELRKESLERVRGLGKKFFRPSEAGRCSRCIALRIMGRVPKEKDPQLIMLLDDGDYHAETVKAKLRQVTDVTKEEEEYRKKVKIKGYPSFSLRGHVDGVIDKGTTILEIKGINRFTFKTYKNQRTFKKAYLYQIQCYLYLSGLGGALLVIKCKDTSEWLTFEVKRDNKLIFKLMKKFARIQKYLDQGKLPPPTFAPGTKEYRECQYDHTEDGGFDKKVVSSTLKENPYGKGEERLIDMSPSDTEGRSLLLLCEHYVDSKKKAKEADETRKLARESILKILEKHRVQGASVKFYKAFRKGYPQTVPDRGVIEDLVEAGTIPVRTSEIWRLEVKDMREEV